MGGIVSSPAIITPTISPKNETSLPLCKFGNSCEDDVDYSAYGGHFPSYFIEAATVTDADINCARESWKHILQSTSPIFTKQPDEFYKQHPNCIHWFSCTFYNRLFEIVPQSRQQFGDKDMIEQGISMVRMITMCLKLLSLLDRRHQWHHTLKTLAKEHVEKGVVHAQYGIVGEVLFWTLDHCLGPECEVNIWIKIYSIMLKTIIPTAILYEKHKSSTRAFIDYSEDGRRQRALKVSTSSISTPSSSSSSLTALSTSRSTSEAGLTCRGAGAGWDTSRQALSTDDEQVLRSFPYRRPLNLADPAQHTAVPTAHMDSDLAKDIASFTLDGDR